MERADKIAEEDRAPGPAAATAAPGSAASWRTTFQSLGNPAFRLFWLGMLGSYAGFQMSFVARGYLAFQLGGTATAVGLVGLARGVPPVFLALLGGAVADRVDRRKLVMTTQFLMGAMQVINALLNIAGVIELWHLVLLMAGEGILFSFNAPGRQALLPQIVTREELPNAIALNSVGMNLAGIGGPALAGILIALPWVGVGGTFLVTSALFAIAVLALLNLPVRTAPSLAQRPPILREMKDGFLYLRASPTLAALIAMAMVPMLLGWPYNILLPVFQERVFHVGSAQLGLMYTMTGVGAVVGSLTVAYLAQSRRRARWQLLSGLGFGLALFLFAASGRYSLALPALMLVGLASNSYLAINNTLILLNTDPSHYGRISSYLLIMWALMPVLALPLGILADAFSPQAAIGGAGILIVLFLLAFVALAPAYRRMAATI